MAFLTLVFLALGTWQVQRLFWKLDLIARTDARIHAEPVEPPARDAWPTVDAANAEYLRVRTTGTFVQGNDAFVQAVTALGPGFWVLTPLRRADGTTILINRGFISADRRNGGYDAPADGETTVTGLLRITEPKGGFLRSNDPAGGRWYSRDVAALSQSFGLTEAAPYFIDAEAGVSGRYPVGGLTVVTFRNSHLVYALTWYTLAIMTTAAGIFVVRTSRRRRQA